MHEFEEFRAPDAGAVDALVRAMPFATVVSTVEGGHGPVPTATHVPVIPDPAADTSSGLQGTALWGHMARANPQWRSFAPGSRVLVIFAGPNGYVSPSTYAVQPAAPTWNYAAVHAVGPVEVLEDPEDALQVITATVDALEQDRDRPFDVTDSLAYYRRILPGVTAFRVRVESVQAVFKLSQDKPDELYERVRDAFVAGRAPEVATLMTAANGERGCPIT